jgi:peptidoglycan/xylan/chitin deacetylase (PgdA/CDA1 family)
VGEHPATTSSRELRHQGRDFSGYGRWSPRVRWPDDARVAVSLVVNYEEGSEASFAAGDDRNEFVGEFGGPINPHADTVRDRCTESIFEYGSRAGVWRLARIFDEFEVKCTFFACAVALEVNPIVGAYIQEAGHEACSHGWRWEAPCTLQPADEAERIKLAVASIESTCGQRPQGWFSRCSPSAHTRELLVAEGGFLYDSDAYNDDLPYFCEVGAAKHLVIPYTFAYNDMRFVFPGFADPMSFFTYCRMALDLLRAEGADRPKMMSIGLHPRWAGQAARAAALRAFVEYALEQGDVWFARRVDIAKWWIENAPKFDSE